MSTLYSRNSAVLFPLFEKEFIAYLTNFIRDFLRNRTNLKGDKGDKGETGSTGIQGIQGEKGDSGTGTSSGMIVIPELNRLIIDSDPYGSINVEGISYVEFNGLQGDTWTINNIYGGVKGQILYLFELNGLNITLEIDLNTLQPIIMAGSTQRIISNSCSLLVCNGNYWVSLIDS